VARAHPCLLDERPVLVLVRRLSSLSGGAAGFRMVSCMPCRREKTRVQFETDTLRDSIPRLNRWYAAKGTPSSRARIVDHVVWQEGKSELDHRAARRHGRAASPRTTSCHLTLAWEERRRGARAQHLDGGHRRRSGMQSSVGVMGDAFADEVFCQSLVAAMAKPAGNSPRAGKLEFRPTAASSVWAGADAGTLPAARPQVQKPPTPSSFWASG